MTSQGVLRNWRQNLRGLILHIKSNNFRKYAFNIIHK